MRDEPLLSHYLHFGQVSVMQNNSFLQGVECGGDVRGAFLKGVAMAGDQRRGPSSVQAKVTR